MGHYDSPLYMGHGGIQFWQKQDLNSTLFIPFTYPFYIPNHVICIFLENCHFSKILYFYQKWKERQFRSQSQKLVDSIDLILTWNGEILTANADFRPEMANSDKSTRFRLG